MEKGVTSDKYRDIFLSHSWKDKPFVRRLQADIEAVEYKGRKLTTWIDEAEIRPGDSITGKINEGLENSRFIGVVMTPDYFKSESGWTYAEWHAALHLDPDNRKCRTIPILAKDYEDIPPLLRHLLRIDLREKNYERDLPRLINILCDEPFPKPKLHQGRIINPDGRLSASTLVSERAPTDAYPDVFDEELYSNLLPIVKLPSHLFAAPITERVLAKPGRSLKWSILTEISSATGEPVKEGFKDYENELITLENLFKDDNPFAAAIKPGLARRIRKERFIRDDDKRRIFVYLLNKAIAKQAEKVGLVEDHTKSWRYFFPPKLGGGPNKIAWPRSRTVAKPLTDTEWLHFGAYLTVFYIAGNFFLKVWPTYLLTFRGSEPKMGPTVGRKVIPWTGRMRNPTVLNHVLCLSHRLSEQKKYICVQVGDQEMIIKREPAFIQQSFGLPFDYRKITAIEVLHRDLPEEELPRSLDEIRREDLELGDEELDFE